MCLDFRLFFLNISVFCLLLLPFVIALCNQVLAKVSLAFTLLNASVWIPHSLLNDAS